MHRQVAAPPGARDCGVGWPWGDCRRWWVDMGGSSQPLVFGGSGGSHSLGSLVVSCMGGTRMRCDATAFHRNAHASLGIRNRTTPFGGLALFRHRFWEDRRCDATDIFGFYMTKPASALSARIPRTRREECELQPLLLSLLSSAQPSSRKRPGGIIPYPHHSPRGHRADHPLGPPLSRIASHRNKRFLPCGRHSAVPV